MNKKGFTLVELLAVLIIIGVLSTVAVTSLNVVLKNSRTKEYKANERSLRGATENLFVECMEQSDSLPYCVSLPTKTDKVRITLDQLVEAKLINKIQDDVTKNYCTGYVDVINTDDNTVKLKYTICLKCDNYKSDTCE